MKKTKRTIKGLLALAALVVSASISAMAQDYNGNLISKNKVIFNSKSSNSYIQSLTSHTINFDGLMDQPFGNNATNLSTTPLGTTFITPTIAGGTNDQCNSIAIQADGKIVMGGSSHSRFAAARFLPNGQLDSSFGGQISQAGTMYISQNIAGGSNDRCRALALQNDGKIVMGGYSNTNHFALARLLSNGTLDSSFGGQISQAGTTYIAPITGGTADQCNAIAIQADEKIVMGGYSTNGSSYFALARLINPMSLQTYQASYEGVGAGLYV